MVPVAQQPLEIVERKGIGHPDSICDGVMEHAAIALARAYRERVGAILHFNLDKALLAAGGVDHRFGGGRVIEPMRLVVGDRATFTTNGLQIPVSDILAEARTIARDTPLAIEVALTTLDQPGRGFDGVYLSLLGTSAKGDCLLPHPEG
jgi:S-adenosylmethionine synthetase